MIAYVLGNGESRAFLNLPKITKGHTIIGCNALYRDIRVDHLICCDKRMAEEAVKNIEHKDTKIYVRDSWYRYFRKIKKDKRVNQLPQVPKPEGSRRKQDEAFHWGSGPYAVLVASALPNVTEVRLLGFDLYGIDNKINNIYKGTPNYKEAGYQAVDPSFWKYQIGKVFSYNSHIKFTIYNRVDWNMPLEWKLNNVNFSPFSLDKA